MIHCLRAAFQFKGNYTTKSLHLYFGNFMPGVRFDTGIKHLADNFMALKIICHGCSIFLVLLHPQRQCLNSTKHQPAVKRRSACSHGIEEKLNPLGTFIRGSDHGTTNNITMPVNVLGGGMYNKVNPIFYRPEKVRSGKGIIYNCQYIAFP